jgi:hypothetical protein
MSAFCKVDEKFVPLHRILWISALPHFCGSNDCQREGHYEIRLEQGETVWAISQAERDEALAALEHWSGSDAVDDDDD